MELLCRELLWNELFWKELFWKELLLLPTLGCKFLCIELWLGSIFRLLILFTLLV